MIIYIFLTISVCFNLYILKTKFVKKPYDPWVYDFYKKLNHDWLAGKENFYYDVKNIKTQEWVKLYRGLRHYHRMPISMFDITHQDIFIIKLHEYNGIKVKLEPYMDMTTPTIEKISIEDHKPLDVTVDKSKIIILE